MVHHLKMEALQVWHVAWNMERQNLPLSVPKRLIAECEPVEDQAALRGPILIANKWKLWGMLPASTSGDASKRTPTDNQTVRNVFVIGPDKRIKLILVYPMTTGRNFDEVLRVIDSLQLTAKHRVATPVNWKQGEDVIIAGSVTDEEAKKTYPNGWKAPRPYIRNVPHPSTS